MIMKKLFCGMCMVWFAGVVVGVYCDCLESKAEAQVKGTNIRSAEAQAKLRELEIQRMIAKSQIENKEFYLGGIKKGYKGTPNWIDCKVLSVVDDNNLLVVLSNSRTGKESVTVWLSVPTTEDLVDGSHWRGGEWYQKVEANMFKVIGTKRYKTIYGNTKTVYHIEAYLDKDVPILNKKK